MYPPNLEMEVMESRRRGKPSILVALYATFEHMLAVDTHYGPARMHGQTKWLRHQSDGTEGLLDLTVAIATSGQHYSSGQLMGLQAR